MGNIAIIGIVCGLVLWGPIVAIMYHNKKQPVWEGYVAGVALGVFGVILALIVPSLERCQHCGRMTNAKHPACDRCRKQFAIRPAGASATGVPASTVVKAPVVPEMLPARTTKVSSIVKDTPPELKTLLDEAKQAQLDHNLELYEIKVREIVGMGQSIARYLAAYCLANYSFHPFITRTAENALCDYYHIPRKEEVNRAAKPLNQALTVGLFAAGIVLLLAIIVSTRWWGVLALLVAGAGFLGWSITWSWGCGNSLFVHNMREFIALIKNGTLSAWQYGHKSKGTANAQIKNEPEKSQQVTNRTPGVPEQVAFVQKKETTPQKTSQSAQNTVKEKSSMTKPTSSSKKSILWLIAGFSVLLVIAVCLSVGAGYYFSKTPPAFLSEILTKKTATPSINGTAIALQATITAISNMNGRQKTLQPNGQMLPTPTNEQMQPLPTQTDTVIPSPSPFPTSTPTGVTVEPFSDSFDNGLRPEWQIDQPAAWGVVDGRLTKLDDSKPIQNSETLWIGNENWENYVVEVDLIKLSGYSFCYLYLADTTKRRGLAFLADWFSQGINFEFDHDNGMLIPNTDVGPYDLPVNIRIVHKGTTFTPYLNGKKLYQINIPTYDVGRIGLFCSGQGTQLDNFKVLQPSDEINSL